MIDAIANVIQKGIELIKKNVDPCKEHLAAQRRAEQELASFKRTGKRKHHRAYLRHKKAARYWDARCVASKAAG